MVLRGLLVAASGFLFIFSPGLPIGLLTRRSPPFKRELIYWGVGIWIVTLLPSLFLQSLLRQILSGGQPPAELTWSPLVLGQTLFGALLTAIFVQAGMWIVLLRGRQSAGPLLLDGMALGFGIGLVAQVFTGLSLVGAGFQMMYGNFSSTSALAGFVEATPVELFLSLVPLILFRPALLVVSAVQGVLVGRSVENGRYFFWLAVLVNVAFAWGILALQLAFGVENPGQVLLGASNLLTSIVTIVYYLLAFFLAYRWLLSQLAVMSRVNYKKSYKRKGS
jgi:hypothetical protein